MATRPTLPAPTPSVANTEPASTTSVPDAEPLQDAAEAEPVVVSDLAPDETAEARSPSDAEVALAVGLVRRAVDVGTWTYIEGVVCLQELVVDRGLSRICVTTLSIIERSATGPRLSARFPIPFEEERSMPGEDLESRHGLPPARPRRDRAIRWDVAYGAGCIEVRGARREPGSLRWGVADDTWEGTAPLGLRPLALPPAIRWWPRDLADVPDLRGAWRVSPAGLERTDSCEGARTLDEILTAP